ncbi:DUF6434 domain-containing protein [Leucobacter sp. HY1908]
MTSAPSERPPLSVDLSEQEFLRWYWLKAELEAFARELGVRASGSKDLLTARVCASLSQRAFVEPAPARTSHGAQLVGPLLPTTVIPAGQRSSQVVRAWMRAQVGSGFHFDAAMREFFAQADGTQTMQDAVDHFHATRDGHAAKPIDRQFEYNRFTRAWHREHPAGTRDELLAAWRAYRNAPIEDRGRA